MKRTTLLIAALTYLLGLCAVGMGQDGPPVGISYSLEKAGDVSVAVYDPDSGRMLRTLQAGRAQDAGEHTVRWDGLDQRGNPVEPGRYEWRLLRVPGFTAEYRTSVGTNSPDARWAFWPGNHGGVSGVAADQTGIYVGATSSELPPTFVKLSPDYQERLWEKHHYQPWKGGKRLMVRNGRLYVDQGDGILRIADAETGRSLESIDVAWDDDLSRKGKERKGAGEDLSIGVAGKHAVVAYGEQDRLRWYELEEGEVVAAADISAPSAVDLDADGAVYVASGGELLQLDGPEADAQVLAEGLTNPSVIEVDRWTEEILVVEGKPSHQIKRFNLEGKLLQTYGKSGGRPTEGPYEELTSFHKVSDVAALPDGGFIVTEPTVAPRRTAVFNRAGELVTEWYGGQMYFQSSVPDPRQSREVWLDSHWGWLIRARVDYEKGTWRPIGNYRYGGKAQGMIAVHNRLPGYASTSWRPVYHEGTRYLVHEGQLTIMRHEEESGRLVPVAVGRTNITHHWDAQPEFIKDLLEKGRKSKYRSYLWLDDNGDGEVQGEEVRFSTWGGWGLNWAMEDDFDFVIADSKGRVHRLPVEEWTDEGIPQYPSLEEMELVAEVDAPLQDGSNPLGEPWSDSAGDFYCVQRGTKDKHGDVWPSHDYGDSRLLKFSPDGRVKWAVGRKAVETPAPPNHMHTPLRVIGQVRDCVVLAERTVSPATVYTRDGLYVGRFLDHRAEDGLPDRIYHWWRDPETKAKSPINYDMLRGGNVTTTRDGKIYWLAAGWNVNPAYRIHGWEGWRRKSGTVTIDSSPPHARAEGRGLTARYFADPADVPSMENEESADDGEKERDPLNELFNDEDAEKEQERKLVVERVDDQIFFRWGGKRIKAHSKADKLPEGVSALAFEVEWTGFVEPKYSEPFVFSTYTRGGVRLWIDDELVIDDWTDYEGEQPYQYTRREFYKKNASKPVELTAGKRVSIRMAYYQSELLEGKPERNIPQAHLNWESPTLSREHIPTAYLYPAERSRKD
ncbi:MAG: PA14 domain-containing protein [Planctomycetota bacterium]